VHPSYEVVVKVLICGDHPSSRGGMAMVMRTMDEFLQSIPAHRQGLEWRFLDPRGQEDWTLASFFRAMARIISQLVRGVDLVHLNTASWGSTYRNMIIARVATVCRTPYVIHLHGGGYREFVAGTPWIVRRLVLQYFAGAVEVLALTPGWGQFLAAELGVPVEKLRTVPNGTDAPGEELLNTARDDIPTFVFVGRLTDSKGVPALTRAFAGVVSETGARLLLVGGDIDREAQAALASALEGVEVAGWVDHGQVLALMARARAVVLPSRRENMPLTVLEAMSVGTAVVATRVGGVPEIFDDGVEGLLVDVQDEEQLRDALLSLCRSPEQAQALGARGRQRWLRDYDGAVMARRLVECWRQACA
jgi:glycosyltransferase involved in cell wall biosynthesis